MKQYLVCERGYGGDHNGCDYTIGCNQRWRIEGFDGNLEEATAHFTKEATTNEEEDYYIEHGELPVFSEDHGVSKMIIVPLEYGFSDPNLEAMRAAYLAGIQAKIDAEKKIESEAHDRAEFERLQKKFGSRTK